MKLHKSTFYLLTIVSSQIFGWNCNFYRLLDQIKFCTVTNIGQWKVFEVNHTPPEDSKVMGSNITLQAYSQFVSTTTTITYSYTIPHFCLTGLFLPELFHVQEGRQKKHFEYREIFYRQNTLTVTQPRASNQWGMNEVCVLFDKTNYLSIANRERIGNWLLTTKPKPVRTSHSATLP